MTDSSALSFGEELRRERIIRDISLEEISQVTKISVRLLKALEDSNVRILPAPTFTRGFIRAYSRYLGIDPEEKVNAYLADLAGESKEPALPKKARPRSRFFRGRRSTAGTIVGAVIAVLVILGLIASPDRRQKLSRAASQERLVAPPKASPVVLKNVEVSNEPTPVLQQPVEHPAAAAALPASPQVRMASEPADGPAITLVLEFAEDSWTKLEADGRTVLNGVVRHGQIRRFQARGGFRLSLGNAGGVRISVDGRALDPLGGTGEVIKNIVLPAPPARG
ncbi:MAG TPA: RodZ domain-containing protein [Thermoanaerobaculia bacterium]|nr:RodZ domain-containing protein [Thermoanaerobaculia bacterium]